MYLHIIKTESEEKYPKRLIPSTALELCEEIFAFYKFGKEDTDPDWLVKRTLKPLGSVEE